VKKIPGYYRYRKGSGFSYQNESGLTVVSQPIRRWIESLVIPPAWRDVWISKDKMAFLLATGYDTKNRKQYQYHEQWTEIREARKHTRMLRLGEALPKIRAKVNRDLKGSDLSRARVLASMVEIIDTTGMRVGSAAYTKANHSYGITTLRKKHVHDGDSTIEFNYLAKSGKERTIAITDQKLVDVITQCEETPGLELFKYFDEQKQKQSISSDEVNEYIHAIAKQSVTAKDFRNWYGTVSALQECIAVGSCNKKCLALHKKSIFTPVSKKLGNTPKVAAESYIHKVVIDCHENNQLKYYQHPATKWRTQEEEMLLAMLREYEKTAHPERKAANL